MIKYLDKINYTLDFYIIPPFLILFGLFTLIVPLLYDDTPSPDNTFECSGTLAEYHYYQWGRGKRDYWVIFKLKEYQNEFQNDFLNKAMCEKYLINGKTLMKFYVHNKDKHRINSNKRIGTFGTYVDNTVLQTKEQDIEKIKGIEYFLPFLGIILMTMGYLFYRRAKREHS